MGPGATDDSFEARVRRVLGGRRRAVLPDEAGLARAAVLFPLLRARDGYRVLLTRRTETVGTHKGQISFPGGRSDPEDADAFATALREAEEELGIRPADVTVLGALDDRVTITSFLVTPVVGVLDHPYPVRPHVGEIAEVLEIPLARFADPRLHRIEAGANHRGEPQPVHFYDVEGAVVWGATARFVHTFLELVGPPPAGVD